MALTALKMHPRAKIHLPTWPILHAVLFESNLINQKNQKIGWCSVYGPLFAFGVVAVILTKINGPLFKLLEKLKLLNFTLDGKCLYKK